MPFAPFAKAVAAWPAPSTLPAILSLPPASTTHAARSSPPNVDLQLETSRPRPSAFRIGEDEMRRFVLARLACLWGVPAASYCEDEVHAARARAWNSGPFHFETTRWSKGLRARACGEIVPDVAERERSCDT